MASNRELLNQINQLYTPIDITETTPLFIHTNVLHHIDLVMEIH